MTISRQGVQFIASFEGFSARPYLDSVKVATIGYGSTIYPNGKKVSMADKDVTREQALEYLEYHVRKHVDPVLAKYTLIQCQYDALASFIYNLGDRLTGSTLEKRVKTNSPCQTITEAFLMWSNAGGKRLEGLVRRRTAEAKLYCTGKYS